MNNAWQRGFGMARRCGFIVCVLAVCWTPPPSFAAPLNTICFYSAETNINNFKSLKQAFDAYLATFGAFAFQPFNDRATFETYLAEHPECVALLSSWHYANIYQQFHLTPVLVGMRDGANSQKNVLTTRQETLDINAAKAGQIASARSVEYTKDLLREVVGEAVEQCKILTVPKDMDALISLGLGMAKSAITTAHSLQEFARMNPALFQKLKTLAETQESLLLIVAVSEQREAEAQELIAILRGMPDQPNGKENLKMLGLDNWQPLGTSDLMTLEK